MEAPTKGPKNPACPSCQRSENAFPHQSHKDGDFADRLRKAFSLAKGSSRLGSGFDPVCYFYPFSGCVDW